MYALPTRADRAGHLCVPPDPGIEPAALAAGEAAALGASVSPAPVAVSLADPSGGPVLAHFSTVLPCPAAPSGTLSGLYLPSFSTNLVSGDDLQDAGVSPVHSCESAGDPLHGRSDRPTPGHVYSSAGVEPRGSSGLPLTPPIFLRQRPRCSRFTWTCGAQPASVDRVTSATSCSLLTTTRVTPQSSFPLRSKGDVTEVLIDWIRAARLQLRQSFGSDFPVLRLHSDRGGVFSSGLLRAYCRARGIRQTFTLPDFPQQNGIAERRIGMVMDVARTSMMHAAAPHFLWPFAVRYAANQINLHPRVSTPETSPALLWTGKVGDASAFHVWGSRAFVRDLSADKLSPRATPCVFLGFPPDAPGWQFYHPTSRRVSVLPGRHVCPRYTLSSLSRSLVTLVLLGVLSLGPEGATTGVLSLGVLSLGVLRLGVLSLGVLSLGVLRLEVLSLAVLRVLRLAGPPLSPQELRDWFARRWRRAAGAGGAAGTGGSATAKSAGATGPGGARIGSTGDAGPAVLLERELLRVLARRLLLSVLRVLSLEELREWFARRWSRAAGARGSSATEGAADAGPGGARTGSAGAARPAVLTGAGASEGVDAETTTGGPARGAPGAAEGSGAAGGAAGAGAPAGGTCAVPAVSGVATRPRPYFVPLLQQVIVTVAAYLTFVCSSPYTGPTGGLAERREPASRPTSPVRAAHASGRGSRQGPPPVPGTHRMSLRPSTAPLRAPLPSLLESSLPALADPESDSLRAASPTVMRLLATVVADPSFESTAAAALVAELVDFAARCRLDYAASLVAESEQEEFQCLAAASPHLVFVLLTPEGDPDALDIPTPRSYVEAIEGPYSSQWQAAMDAEMASWKSTGTYVDAVPPPGANIVSGMWIFRVKRPPGSPPVF
ncbi:unnamed protein product [Closterium sp. NIES-65]|nr:unnamed protein product [Closterium sp. NIES-65]